LSEGAGFLPAPFAFYVARTLLSAFFYFAPFRGRGRPRNPRVGPDVLVWVGKRSLPGSRASLRRTDEDICPYVRIGAIN